MTETRKTSLSQSMFGSYLVVSEDCSADCALKLLTFLAGPGKLRFLTAHRHARRSETQLQLHIILNSCPQALVLQELLTNGRRIITDTNSAGEAYSVSANISRVHVIAPTASGGQKRSRPAIHVTSAPQSKSTDPESAQPHSNGQHKPANTNQQPSKDGMPAQTAKPTDHSKPGNPTANGAADDAADHQHGPCPGHLHQALHPDQQATRAQAQQQQSKEQREGTQIEVQNAKTGPRSRRPRKQKVPAELQVISSPGVDSARQVTNAVDMSSSPAQSAGPAGHPSFPKCACCCCFLAVTQHHSKHQLVVGRSHLL